MLDECGYQGKAVVVSPKSGDGANAEGDQVKEQFCEDFEKTKDSKDRKDDEDHLAGADGIKSHIALSLVAKCAMSQEMVAKNEIGHRFNDGNRAGEDAGVVASPAFEFGILFVFGDGGLR